MLSVIVPTYNRPEMLAECLTSIARTELTSKKMEVLVWDDCSERYLGRAIPSVQDIETVHGDIVRGRLDSRFWLNQHDENRGTQANVADALKHASGDYICVVPDDDTVNPGNFERKVAILDAHPEVGFVYSKANIMNAEGKILGTAHRQEYRQEDYVANRNEFRDLLSGNWIYGASVVFRRSLLDRLDYQDMAIPATLADWDTWLRYSYDSSTAYIAEPLVNVRLHDGALSDHYKSMAVDMLKVWQKWLIDGPLIDVDTETWNRMRMVYTSEVMRLIESQEEQAEAIAKFNTLHLLYAIRREPASGGLIAQ